MKFLREPLLHFLVLGTAIFGAYSLLSRRSANEPQKIVVTQGRIETLATTFRRSWQRPPTPAELDGLIRDYVREEIAAREAVALGLDKDDTVIRRRLRQKLEFLSEDTAAAAEPTDEDLRAFLQAHPERFGIEPRISFRQVYLDPQRHRENLSRDASRLLAQLRKGSDPAAIGDSILLEQSFEDASAGDVSKNFGAEFTGKLAELPVGIWQGPVSSGYGVHLVLVSRRVEGRLPSLEEAREAVRREWANEHRSDTSEKFYKALLKRYTVTIEKPAPPRAAQALP